MQEVASLRPQGDTLALRFHLTRLSNSLGTLGEKLFSLVQFASGLWWLSTGLYPCGNGIVRNDQPPAYGQLWHWHTVGNCPCTRSARTHSCAIVPVAPVGCVALVVVGTGTAAQHGCPDPQFCRHPLPVNLLPTHCRVLRPTDCHSIVRLGGDHLIVLAFTTPLAVRIRTVFDPSIGPKTRLAQSENPKGPNDGLMAAAAFPTRLPISTNRKSISHDPPALQHWRRTGPPA